MYCLLQGAFLKRIILLNSWLKKLKVDVTMHGEHNVKLKKKTDTVCSVQVTALGTSKDMDRTVVR